ncbi:S8 family serine peptidase [Paenibacillus physcomitrellae]|uniref:Serine protease n=2 Tax=Paenibacillus physcomitrellae TaxID=1619311 RepID=A0ABQ1GCF5_9BACL|nr:hypothetical protein GCM10010917_27920 [Paenibacillus physcomitrellae]
MVNRNRLNKHFSIGMTMLLTFSLITPFNPASAKSADYFSLRNTHVETLAVKVDPKLNKQFDQSEYVTYLVKMKEQTDTTSVSRQALQKASLQKATPSAAKLSARSAVVSSLRATASQTQFSLEQYLDDAKEAGKVKTYKSYFIVNALAVTSTKEVMEAIAKRGEVDKILPDETRYLQDTTVTPTLEKPAATVQTPSGSALQSGAAADKDKGSAGGKNGAAPAASSAPAAPAPGTSKPGSSSGISLGVQTGQDTKTSQSGSGKSPTADDPNVEWNIERVNAPEVWAKGIDGTGIVVASLDTGVDYTHPALERKWRGLDANGNIVHPELSWYDAFSGDPLPNDNEGHGTHTMGTMVGSEENGTNKIGVAPGAKWIAVRIFNPDTTDSIILDGAQWLMAPVDDEGNLHPELAPDVVNNSWGGGPGLDEWFRPTVQAWRDAQIFPEFSAGNTTLTNPGGPGSVANPANYPEAFATGATDINDQLADFSLQGPSPYGEVKPEVSAPGVNIRSSVPGGYEGGWNGTSMAGPHTTAIAALLLQANHSLTVDDLENILMDTAVPRTDGQFPTSPNNGYGHGIVNALDAVGSVLEGIGSVSGKVSTGGDDTEEPVIEHTPVTAAFVGSDLPVTIHATDDVSILNVDVYARTKGMSNYVYIPAELVSGDYKDGVYAASIPSFLVQPAGLEYYIRVNDYGNNGYDSEVYPVEVSSGVKAGYVEDFENGFVGFSTGGAGKPWEWGTPVSGPGSAASGDKVFATNLTGTYAAGSNSYLLAPPIDLTDSESGALVSFKQWYDIEDNFDSGTVYLASESTGNEFVPVNRFDGQSGGWKTQYLDLTPYKGETVSVLFDLVSDGGGQAAGWYIDDFKVEDLDQTPPSAPTALTASADILGNVSLTWTAPQDEDLKQFKIYRSENDNASYEEIGTSQEPGYMDTLSATDATYYYKVAAVDYSGNTGPDSNEVSLNIHAPEVVYSDSFDSDSDNGWTHSGTQDEWERGTPNVPQLQAAASPPNVWGTDLDGSYENGADASLYSPVIDLTNVPEAVLLFNNWYAVEAGYDNAHVEITRDGGATWNELTSFTGANDGTHWTPVISDLTEYAGSSIQIRFRLTSDGSVTFPGWYVDDLRILAVSPPEGAASKGWTGEVKPESAKNPSAEPLIKRTVTDQETFEQQAKSAAHAEPAVSSGASARPEGGAADIGIQSLPTSATVTVLETGRSVNTDPASGKYSLTHIAGDYNLKAEAYGYYPQTKPVTIADGGTAKVNFSLEPIPRGVVHGLVTDERTGEPIANARVLAVEDTKVAPAQTAEDGSFTLTLLEGTYSLLVQAGDYYSTTETVTVAGNDSTQVVVSLKPFVGIEGELAYDDGTAENAWAFNAGGNAWGIRFTPDSEAAMITGARLTFWGPEFPSPGGTAFQYAVYDATGADGAPGNLVAGPFDATALRDETQWTEVELPQPVTVQGDFYIVYIQSNAGTASPALATDEDTEATGRAWEQVSGVWAPSAVEGNFMVRAEVKYAVNAPVILTPAPASYTNVPDLTVTGTSTAEGSEITIYNDDTAAGTGVIENKTFSVPVTLHPGSNTLTAEAEVNGKATDRSEPVVITLDQTAPELVVTTPAEGTVMNGEVVTVTGTTSDENFDTLLVNGQPVEPNSDGSFTSKLIVEEGDNTITVTAQDLDGNETTEVRTVHVSTALPELTNMEPSQDVHIASGEPLTVSFDSAPGLTASFRIELPLPMSTFARSGVAMTETEPGHYVGTYSTPASLKLDGGVIVITAADAAGNEVEAEAPGKLYVGQPEGGDGNGGDNGGGNPGEPGDPGNPGDPGTPGNPDNPGDPTPPANQPPVAVIDAPDQGAKKEKITFSAAGSTDPDGRIVKYEWDFSDGNTATKQSASHKFSHKGSYTVTLTVTDDKGAKATAEHVIVIR